MSTESSAHILLVEDDPFLAGMYVTKLELEGYQVSLATDGKAGLETAQREKPDCILLDILLPKMDGFEVLESLKADQATTDIPVVLMTNLGSKQDVVRGLSMGATDYLIKAHFMPSEVMTKIQNILAASPHGRHR